MMVSNDGTGILIYAPTDEDGCIRADLGAATTEGAAAVGTAGVGRGHKSVLELRPANVTPLPGARASSTSTSGSASSTGAFPDNP